MSWDEAQQSCASHKQRLFAPRNLADYMDMFNRQDKLNIEKGKGVHLGDVIFTGISKKAHVGTSHIWAFRI